MAIDWNFIEEMEGFSYSLYVPNEHGQVIGDSGATVAMGIDLGQYSLSQIEEMNLSDDLVNKLIPYIGKRGQAALEYVEENPLTLSQYEANSICSYIQDAFETNLANLYNKYSDVNFNKLTDAQQTVLSSVAWQYGLGIAKRCPHFWNAVTSQNWNQVIEILQNFGDAYSNRRNNEAEYLEQNS